MGFMDKVKAQATVLAEKAQEGAKAGQAKISEMQAKKHADSLLLELGGIVYIQQAGRAAAGADARFTELITEISSFEAEHGPVVVTAASAAPTAPDGSFVPTATAAGDTPPSASAPATTTVPGGGGVPQFTGGIPTGSYSSDTEASTETSTEASTETETS
jgi:hypothetical protein